jgi:ADP-ribose pyrophosphatase
MHSWVETSRELVLKTNLFRLFRVGFRSRASGKEGKFDVLETKDWINVVPVTTSGEVLMVRQFRFGSSEDTLEFPAGTVDPGEDPAHTAVRELAEETGAQGGKWVTLGSCRPNPAIHTNTCHHYAVEGLSTELGPVKFDEHEEITLVRVPVEKIDGMIASGEISHALTIVSWHFYKAHKGAAGA